MDITAPVTTSSGKSRRPLVLAIAVIVVLVLVVTGALLVFRPAAPVYALEEALTDAWVAEGGEVTEEATLIAQQTLAGMVSGEVEMATHPENEGLRMVSDLVDGYMVLGMSAENGMGNGDFQEVKPDLEEQHGVRFGTASEVTGGNQYLVVALALGDLMKVTVNGGDLPGN